jgi:tetratricopeptide (TPR) repeat protein
LPEIHRGYRRLLLVLVLVALALRIAYIIDISDSPHFKYPILDPYWYDSRARDVLAGDLLASSGSFRVPLYIYYVAMAYLVFGLTYFGPLIGQAVLGALSCGLVAMIARKVFGRAAGILAGAGFALYGMAIYSDGELQPTTLFMTLMLGSVYFVLPALENRRPAYGLLAGACLGLAFLTRPDILPFAVLLVLVLLLAFRARGGVRVAVFAAAVLVCFMALLGIRNHRAFGEFYVFSPQGAVNLYIGNARYADGKAAVAPPTRYPYDVAADPAEDSVTLACRQAAAEETGRMLSDRELSRYYVRKTFSEIGADPVAWLGLAARKSYYFLNSYERSDVKLLPRFIEKHSRVLKLPLLNYGTVLVLGAAGIFLSVRRRNRLAWIPAAGVAAYAVNSVMFFVLWRFRLPAVPFLIMFAGYGAYEIYMLIRRRSWRTLALTAALAAVVSLVSFSRIWDVREEEWEAHFLQNEGAIHAELGQFDMAIEVYNEAIQADPSNARSYFYLGKVYATQGMPGESKEMMDRATALNPSYRPFANLTLGVAMAGSGDYESAAVYFAAALEADPELGLAAYNLGLSLANLGRIEEAERAFSRAEFLCKDDIGTQAGIARAYVGLGRPEKGLSQAQRVLRVDPANVDALYAAASALESLGRQSEALAYYEHLLRYMPQSAEIRQKVLTLRARGAGNSR